MVGSRNHRCVGENWCAVSYFIRAKTSFDPITVYHRVNIHIWKRRAECDTITICTNLCAVANSHRIIIKKCKRFRSSSDPRSWMAGSRSQRCVGGRRYAVSHLMHVNTILSKTGSDPNTVCTSLCAVANSHLIIVKNASVFVPRQIPATRWWGAVVTDASVAAGMPSQN